MKKLVNKLDRNDIIFTTVCYILMISFIRALFGNEFAKEVFKATFVVPITVYVTKNKKEDKICQ